MTTQQDYARHIRRTGVAPRPARRTMTTRPIVPAILFAVIINFGAVDFARADSGDVDQIRALESKLAAAAEARNIDAIMKAYIPDETLFVFDVIPPRQYVGAKAFRTDWDEFLGSTKGPLKYEISDVDVTAVGTVAYGHSIQRIVATSVKGDPIDLTTRVTDVYRKIDGNWMIVQEHISIPVDLDTGKPDLSSKP
jgi:ketosteroid isomerase-like protein